VKSFAEVDEQPKSGKKAAKLQSCKAVIKLRSCEAAKPQNGKAAKSQNGEAEWSRSNQSAGAN